MLLERPNKGNASFVFSFSVSDYPNQQVDLPVGLWNQLEGHVGGVPEFACIPEGEDPPALLPNRFVAELRGDQATAVDLPRESLEGDGCGGHPLHLGAGAADGYVLNKIHGDQVESPVLRPDPPGGGAR